MYQLIIPKFKSHINVLSHWLVSGDIYKIQFQVNVKYSSCWPYKNENQIRWAAFGRNTKCTAIPESLL
jgi:hypothetical protein